MDVSRFAGTCYRASNWRSLGLTRGFAREPGGAARWRHHGQPKERDFTYDEDRCRAYVRHLPRNLACLTNAAIAIVRFHGRSPTCPRPTATMPPAPRRPSTRS